MALALAGSKGSKEKADETKTSIEFGSFLRKIKSDKPDLTDQKIQAQKRIQRSKKRIAAYGWQSLAVIPKMKNSSKPGKRAQRLKSKKSGSVTPFVAPSRNQISPMVLPAQSMSESALRIQSLASLEQDFSFDDTFDRSTISVHDPPAVLENPRDDAKYEARKQRAEPENTEALRAQEEAAALAREREDPISRQKAEENDAAQASVLSAVAKYSSFIGQMEAYELLANDPERLMGSSRKLMEQERFRKVQWQRLGDLQRNVKAALDEYGTRYQDTVRSPAGRDVAADLAYDMKIRFAGNHSIPAPVAEGTPGRLPGQENEPLTTKRKATHKKLRIVSMQRTTSFGNPDFR